ncbi:MAG: thioredoxin domain-containing protein [Deltaproteobacteria bacterium]|jgi:thioredoxin 1|nr:thioredoxin domain-containing protein [Deltaproteobacteria bacterium]
MVIISLPLWIGACGRGSQKAVVAEVNGQRITVKDFQEELARTPEDMRAVYEQEPEEVLDRLIGVTLLLQEAKRRGLVDSSDLRDIDKPRVKEGMRRLMEQSLKGVDQVTDKEVQAFYRQYRAEMEGKPLSEVRELLRMMILEQKRQVRISVLVEKLRTQAAITTFPERLPKPPPPALEAATADAFQAALKSGRPTLLDFASKSCPACIRLRPVMGALKDAHKERINVLFLEVSANRDLALYYKVRLVPTLIFFDAQGREVHREMGFMRQEAIEKVLRDLKLLGG